MDKPQEKQSVIRSAAAMSLGTMSSRVLGLLRDILLAAFFSNTVKDAFVVAFRLPNMFRRLLGEGALSVSFIPIYVDQLTQKPGESLEEVNERSKELAGALFTLLWAVAGTLCVLGVIFMGPIMKVFVSGDSYSYVAGKMEMTILFGRIMFSYLFLVTTYAYFMAIMNALKKFFLPALAPAFFNLTFIIFALLPAESFGIEGLELAWGVLAGGFVQVLVVGIPLYKRGFLPRFRWKPKSKNLLLVLRNMVPGLLGMGILQLMGLVNVNYASRLSEGSHFFIYVADRILELPQSLIAISMGAALLPTLSEQWAKGDKDKMRETGQRHMRVLFYLVLPCALGMYLLAQPIVEVLFKRGSFTSLDAIKTAQVIKIYSFLLIAAAFYKVTVPNFYAIKNTWLPALTTFFALVFHAILAHFWVDTYGLKGLVGSMALATLINLILVLVAYRSIFGSLKLFSLIKSILHQLPALALMGAFILFSYENIFGTLERIFPMALAQTLALLATVISAALLYFVTNDRVRHPIGVEVHAALLKRFGPRS